MLGRVGATDRVVSRLGEAEREKRKEGEERSKGDHSACCWRDDLVGCRVSLVSLDGKSVGKGAVWVVTFRKLQDGKLVDGQRGTVVVSGASFGVQGVRYTQGQGACALGRTTRIRAVESRDSANEMAHCLSVDSAWRVGFRFRQRSRTHLRSTLPAAAVTLVFEGRKEEDGMQGEDSDQIQCARGQGRRAPRGGRACRIKINNSL